MSPRLPSIVDGWMRNGARARNLLQRRDLNGFLKESVQHRPLTGSDKYRFCRRERISRFLEWCRDPADEDG